jgi:hypothetical protein
MNLLENSQEYTIKLNMDTPALKNVVDPPPSHYLVDYQIKKN